MSQLDEYLTEYIAKRAVELEKYVLDAYNNDEKRLLCIESFQGTTLSSQDLKNCEFLKDAEIFSEEIKLQRNGHNRYRVFRLTPKGMQFAQELTQNTERKELDAKITVG